MREDRIIESFIITVFRPYNSDNERNTKKNMKYATLFFIMICCFMQISCIGSEEQGIQQTEVVAVMDNYNLCECGNGRDDQIVNWWFYPQILTTNLYRKTLLWGWTSSTGESGVSQIDFEKPTLTKRVTLKRIAEIDDHNACFVYELSDGRIAVGYHGNHTQGNIFLKNTLYIRISKGKDTINEFEDVIRINYNDRVNYGQCFYINNKYYIFSRIGRNSWCFVSSDDFINWSSPVTFMTTENQFYMKLQKVLGDKNKLRFCMYQHPDFYSDIKMGFIDFVTGKVLDGDGETVMGTLGHEFNFSDFTTIVKHVVNKKIRLLDVAITDTDESLILVCDYTSAGNDGIYYVVRDGVRELIREAGVEALRNDYPLGASFINSNSVVAAYGNGGKDFVAIFDYLNQVWNNNRVIFNERRTITGADNNRNLKPIVDPSGKFIVWFKGYYEHYRKDASHKGFDTDAMIYDIEKDEII